MTKNKKYCVVLDYEGYFLMILKSNEHVPPYTFLVSEHDNQRDAEFALSLEIQREG